MPQSEAQYAVIDAATLGNNTLVAAVTGKQILVLAAVFVAAGAVTAQLQAGAGGTNLTGAMAMGTNTVIRLPYNPAGWCKAAVATLLNLNLSAAVGVRGCLVYALAE